MSLIDSVVSAIGGHRITINELIGHCLDKRRELAIWNAGRNGLDLLNGRALVLAAINLGVDFTKLVEQFKKPLIVSGRFTSPNSARVVFVR